MLIWWHGASNRQAAGARDHLKKGKPRRSPTSDHARHLTSCRRYELHQYDQLGNSSSLDPRKHSFDGDLGSMEKYALAPRLRGCSPQNQTDSGVPQRSWLHAYTTRSRQHWS